MTGLVVVAGGVVVYRLAGWSTDDTYITLRFAGNALAQGARSAPHHAATLVSA
jgi:hypothetical protein